MTLKSNTRPRLKGTLKNARTIILLGCIFGIIIGTSRSIIDSSAKNEALLFFVSVASYLANIYIYLTISINKRMGKKNTRYLLIFSALVLLLLFIPHFIISVVTVGCSSLLRFLWHGIAIVVSATGFMLLTPKFVRLIYEDKVLPSRGWLRQHREKMDVLYFIVVITLFMLAFSMAGSSNVMHYSAGLPLLPVVAQEFSILCCCNVCSHKLLATYNKL
ncbi:MAG: hypothetical protein AB7E32_01690 [Desulfovibrio sp.]